MKKPDGIQKVPEFTKEQIKWLSIAFKSRRAKADLKQMALAFHLNINMNILVDFEKKGILPGRFESVRIVVNYALTGKY